METLKGPNYKKIYEDILQLKYPEKREQCKMLLSKTKLSVRDIIEINSVIFSKTEIESRLENGRHRSYDKFSILELLDYQKKNQLNNSQLAIHFKLSRNSIAKWKKQFLI